MTADAISELVAYCPQCSLRCRYKSQAKAAYPKAIKDYWHHIRVNPGHQPRLEVYYI